MEISDYQRMGNAAAASIDQMSATLQRVRQLRRKWDAGSDREKEFAAELGKVLDS